MKARSNYPTKITHPCTAKILKRDRLFKSLDSARQQSKLIWVASPAGSGKTTLLSSYIQEHKLLHCWYQVDEGDRDLATFFHYMGVAGKKAAPRRKKNMPALTAEYLQNITAFTRFFFEDMSSRLKGNGVIILDNFQLFPDNHPIHALLPNIIDSLTEGISLIVISRQLPPKSLTPLLLRNQLITLDTNQIRFDHDEWEKVCRLLKPESHDDSLLSLHEKLDGWVAGLLLSINAPNVFDNTALGMAQTNILEDYIADEFLSSLDTQTNELLMSVCFLQHITHVSVKSLTTLDKPQTILAELASKNLFILQQGEKKYTLHPLVREHLQKKVKNTFSKQARRDLLLASANAMLVQNEYEPAANLLLELMEWELLIDVILAHAEELYNTGRVVPLQNYICALPGHCSENEPWIDYWNGNLIAYRDIKAALKYYDKAYTIFLAESNTKGAYLTWYAAISAIAATLQGSDQLVSWLNRHDELSNKWPHHPDELKRCAIVNMLAKCYFLTDINTQKREFWKKELVQIIHDTDDPVLRLRLIANYITIAAISGIKEQDVLIFEELEKYLSENNIAPVVYIDAIVACTIFVTSFNDHEKLLTLEYQALEIAESNGVSVFNDLLYMGVAYAAVKLNKYALAKEYLQLLEKNLTEENSAYKSSYLMSLLHAGTYMDNIRGVKNIARQYLSNTDKAPLPAFGIHVKLSYLYYLCARSQTDELLTLHDELLEQVTRQALPAQLSRFHMIYAKIFFNTGVINKSDQYLTTSFKFLSDENIISYCYWPAELMTWACQRALALGIETAYVESFIVRHYATLSAPDAQNEPWPWAFRLYTFSHFEISQNNAGDNIIQRRNKSFQLLKVLAGAEKNAMSVTRLKETLYGAHEDKKTSPLLDSHVYRLRKSLGYDDAIIRQGDSISLNLHYFWIDRNAFENLQKQTITPANALEIATKIHAIYRGEYLMEDDSIECIGHRERYRNLYMSVIFKCLDHMGADTERAIDTCLQALVREPFSESLYRKLIGLYLHVGNWEMAETTLQQCCDVLQQHLNRNASEETLSLLNNG